jgi:hypothetical protein
MTPMDYPVSERIIHAYDTELHRIVCGIEGHTNSTKYATAVTCPTCRALLDAQRSARAAALEPHGENA